MFIFYHKRFFFHGCVCFLLFLFTSCSENIYLKKDEKILFSQNIKGGTKLDRSKLKTFFRQVPNQRILGFPLYTHLYKYGEKRYNIDSLKKKIEKTEYMYAQKKQEREKIGERQIQRVLMKQTEALTSIENKYKNTTQKREEEKKKKEHFYGRKIKKVKERTEEKKKKIDSKQTEATENIQSVIKNGTTFMRWGEELAIYQPDFTKITVDRIQQHLYNEGYFNAKVYPETKEVSHKVFVTYRIDEKKTLYYRFSFL